MRVRVLTLAAAAITLAAPATASAYFPHTVSSGESLWSVAAADGLSVDQLAAANGLSGNSQIVAGSTLMIPPQSGVAASGTAAPSTTGSAVDGDGDYDGDVGTAAPASSAATVSAPSGGSYVVQPGDTLSAIAARAGMSVSGLAAANGLDPNGMLLSGKALVLSGGSGGGGSVGSGGRAVAPAPASSPRAPRNRSGAPPRDPPAVRRIRPPRASPRRRSVRSRPPTACPPRWPRRSPIRRAASTTASPRARMLAA